MKKNAKLSITLSSINFEFYGRAIRIAVLKVFGKCFNANSYVGSKVYGTQCERQNTSRVLEMFMI